jgi:hypothetical protein
MTKPSELSEYLVISRGQWDADKSPQEIQAAIDDFYVWHERMVNEGKMKPGQRLGIERKTVSRHGITDGPFTEAKEVIGGYWFIMASSLDEAAQMMTYSPCAACGLTYDIRPIDTERCDALAVTNETPGQARG